MSGPCEDRGADLFLLARDGAAAVADLEDHVAACEGCRGEVDRLRGLAGALPDATGRLRPRPSTKTDLMKEIEAVLAAEAAVETAAPPRRGPLLPRWIPMAALAACLLVTVLVLTRDGAAPPSVTVGGGSVEVRPLFGGTALEGLTPAGLGAGSELSARDTASVRLGAPFDAEVVLGKGAVLRLPREDGADRSLLLSAGAGWFAPSGAGPLSVRAGGARVSGKASFAVELRAAGLVTVIVESGGCTVAAAGADIAARGPCRVEVEPGKAPGPPVPAEASDASAWFSYPVLTLSKEETGPGERPGLVLTLRPSVPRPLPIAPWDRFDPLFSLRFTHRERGLSEVTVGPRLLRRRAPLPGGDGSFLLGPDREYRLHLGLGPVELAPGTYSVEAVYAANRSGGPWRGTRASNAVELVIE